MADFTESNAWASRIMGWKRGEGTLPDPDAFYALLTNGLSISRITSLATIAAAELASTGGYVRKNVDFVASGAIVYDSGANRANNPDVPLIWTATGASIQYDGVVIIADGVSTLADSTGTVVMFYNLASQTIPASASQTITIDNWGYANIGSASGT